MKILWSSSLIYFGFRHPQERDSARGTKIHYSAPPPRLPAAASDIDLFQRLLAQDQVEEALSLTVETIVYLNLPAAM